MKKLVLAGGCGFLLVIGVVLLAAGLYLWSTYNSIVTAEQGIDGAWAQVENNLQRRGDLIPNLVETVKGYAAHEKEVFEKVAEARGRLAGATSPQEAAAANAGLTSALGRLLAIAENYPLLKANENFIRLQDELAGTENRLAVSRRDYNEQVRQYNTLIVRVPANLVAGFFNKKPRDYFEAEADKKTAPNVKF
ncbi:MAG TPA: LemA family protein [Candidatus Polarisedimenticolia bacterium]|jgi:LemA protein